MLVISKLPLHISELLPSFSKLINLFLIQLIFCLVKHILHIFLNYINSNKRFLQQLENNEARNKNKSSW